jgi:thiol-disulfide isomerase/thioredoxin
MKSVIINIALFFVLAAAFSSLTGCGNNVSSEKGPNTNTAGGTPAPETSQNPANTDDASKYPVLSFIDQGEIKNLDGSAFKVGDRRGQVMLLNLWATWCGPCRAEMPELVAMQDKYSDKNFKIIGLNTDNESADDIKNFAGDMKLNYELAWPEQKMTLEFFRYSHFQGIPQSFLVDREGRLRGVFTGGGPKMVAKIKETVEKVIAE